MAEMTPALESWAWEHLDDLESACRKLCHGLFLPTLSRNFGLTDNEIKALRSASVKLSQSFKESLSDRDPEKAFILARIAQNTAPQMTPDGCNRWVGPVQGRAMTQPGGTPVVAFRGRMVSARRILWNYTYPEPDPLFLGWDTNARLRNAGCKEAAHCMNLAHWYKPQGRYAPIPKDEERPENPTSALLRLQRYTAEPGGLGDCARWIGSIQGGQKDQKGGTPVISYQGRTVPARRLAWNIRHRGTDEVIGEHERLRNIGCRLASLCMNLDHWRRRVRAPRVDSLRFQAQFQTQRVEDGRLCQNQKHWLPISARAGCSACQEEVANEQARMRAAAFALGQKLRQQIAAQEAMPKKFVQNASVNPLDT